MLYQIVDATVTAGGEPVLSHVDFEIRGAEKIAVVGKNGAGKTTLLRLIAGELTPDRDDKRSGPGIRSARRATVGMLRQQTFDGGSDSGTVEEELLRACPCLERYDRERFLYEKEYDTLFTGFGFSRADKGRRLSEFSGGERTKIALIRLLLDRPDILLLDEPTNHLDMETAEWLEEYLRRYEKAVVMVSHDRFFLDRTADVVYELERNRLTRYPGNYTHYLEEKGKRLRIQQKAYERQQEELSRLNGLVERFKHKPTKASFARAKKKQMERMDRVGKPEERDGGFFAGELSPLTPGSKLVLDADKLRVGYDKTLLAITMKIRRGQKIGLIGPNGAGKTTFLKTVAGLIPALGGEYALGNRVTIGYFDQHSADIQSEKTVIEHFHGLFPSLTDKEARSVLGSYLFGGKEASKKINSLSGGERARLVLAELLQSRPNFLILDEPTNHMDIRARETLEAAFLAYAGTILFVSHDRYFIRQIADSILIFENGTAMYYPFGYEHYLERKRRSRDGESIAARITAEEQAMIAGLRAVPRAERGRLREIPTEEARRDWLLGPARERMEEAAKAYEKSGERARQARERFEESEAYWAGECPEEPELCRLLAQREASWRLWNESCMRWWEIYEAEDSRA